MFKVITNKKDFIRKPVLEMDENLINNADKDMVHIYGKDYYMYSDEWKHHVHIKCTDGCDADCSFCIEKSERNNPQNPDNLIDSVRSVLDELKEQNFLKTVSITGGEPTCFCRIKELIEIVSKYNPTLLSINTNGRYLDKIPKTFNGWLDISKHAIIDTDVFNRDFNVTKRSIVNFKITHPLAKIRFQCVIGTSNDMATLGNIIDYIYEFKDVVDDFSFRNLIIENNESRISNLFLVFRNMLFDSGELVEQVIQDYYVYETYKMYGTTITISWSNMKKLREYNESHDSNFLEEIIIHPDGTVSGSWNKKSLIIHQPESTKGNEYLPCKGIGCKSHCPRYYRYCKDNKAGIYSCHVDSCI